MVTLGRTKPRPRLKRTITSDVLVFFFQAEDGIRYDLVTGVQTCALPIYATAVGRDGNAVVRLDAGDDTDDGIGDGIDDVHVVARAVGLDDPNLFTRPVVSAQIGRASCRERV